MGRKGLSLTDIVALAKQGYKPSDIKELIELSNESYSNESSSDEDKDNNDSKDEDKDNKTQPDIKNEDDSNTTNEDSETDDPEIVDYKKKVEELEKKIVDLQKKAAHEKVADTSDKKTSEEQFKEAMRNFM